MFKIIYISQLSVFCVYVLPLFMTWHNGCPIKLTTENQKVSEDSSFWCKVSIFYREKMHFTKKCNLRNYHLNVVLMEKSLSSSHFSFYILHFDKKSFSFISSLFSLLKINLYKKLPNCHNITFIFCNPKLLLCLIYIEIKTERNFRDHLAQSPTFGGFYVIIFFIRFASFM